jgi:hypothetical protein
MKWYQVFECDNTVKNPLVCEFDNLEDCSFSEWDFKKGKEIKNWNENIIFQAKKKKNDGDPDDALQSAAMIPIYSARLINALNAENITGIQFLKIKVLRPNNSLINGFCIANLTNFIKALDYEKSVYTRFRDDFPNPNVRGEISGITKYVLRKNNLKGFDIIRLKDYEQAFFVSEKFKEIFEKIKFTGYSFEEVELV